MFAIFTILALLLIAIAAPVWGVDSRDGIEITEWERRCGWSGRR